MKTPNQSFFKLFSNFFFFIETLTIIISNNYSLNYESHLHFKFSLLVGEMIITLLLLLGTVISYRNSLKLIWGGAWSSVRLQGRNFKCNYAWFRKVVYTDIQLRNFNWGSRRRQHRYYRTICRLIGVDCGGSLEFLWLVLLCGKTLFIVSFQLFWMDLLLI